MPPYFHCKPCSDAGIGAKRGEKLAIFAHKSMERFPKGQRDGIASDTKACEKRLNHLTLDNYVPLPDPSVSDMGFCLTQGLVSYSRHQIFLDASYYYQFGPLAKGGEV